MEEEKTEAEVLLNKLLNNQHVSRWDVFKERKAIKLYLQDNEDYSELESEIDIMIESAKESL